MPDLNERIATLETKVAGLDVAVREIRDEQDAARERDTERQVDMKGLTMQLSELIKALSTHEVWHKEHKSGAFNLSNIIVSACALLVLVSDFIIKLAK